MSLFELFVIALGLSMDAFAVSICIGLSMRASGWKPGFIAGAYFGGAQFLMPVVGYFVGALFADAITAFDHWIAFGLLAVIGGNMLRESFDSDSPVTTSLRPKVMIPYAIATSIDALAVGVSFAFLRVQILPASSFIGVTTFLLSIVGLRVGSLFGVRYKSVAERAGGVILILMGVKILLEHLGVLG